MQLNKCQWKIGGAAGFGIATTGLIFSRICARGGLKTFAYPEYPSLIRGGHNTYQVVINEKQATSQLHDVHVLVALNKETVELHADELISGSAVIFDPHDFKEQAPTAADKEIVWVPVEMSRMVKEHQSGTVGRNIVGVGASFALLRYPWEIVEEVIRDWFGTKKPKVTELNIALTKAGYDAVKGKYEQFAHRLQSQKQPKKQLIVSGNTAIALGALKAGMKLYAAYPMTPSSDILGYLSKQERVMNIVVKHTEDEIAAINMAIGAGAAGVRASTATSGGGFALMVEALGMAGIAEVPVVVVLGQRPGPSTGLPTWTSQGDLRFALHASQGEFPRIVLAPGDVEECFYMTFEAFNLAEKYQTPVIIIVDKYVQESWQSIPLFDEKQLKIHRGKIIPQKEIVRENGSFKRHAYTEDGISPRTLPGMQNGAYLSSSYEHDEYGHTTEDEQETIKQNDKRFQKMQTCIEQDAKAPVLYGPKNADVTIVGFGSTKLPALETVRLAQQQNFSVNYLHFVYIDPLPITAVIDAFKQTKKTLCVEGNKLGQFEGWLKEQAGIHMDAHVRSYGGRPFYPEALLAKAKKLL